MLPRCLSLVCCYLVCSLVAVAQQKIAPMVVGNATWLGFGTGYVAKEKGFFGDLNVEFVILDDWTVRDNAFRSGKIDVITQTIDGLAISISNGMKAKMFLIVDESSGADGIVAGPEIKTGADLKGKKIAYTRASCSEFMLIRYLAKFSLTLKDIKSVEVDDPGRGGDAFMAGSVDAAVTWEPMITSIVKSGKGHVVMSSKTFPDLLVDILAATPENLAAHKVDYQKLVNGWLKAIEFIKTNPTEAYAIMAKNFKIPGNDVPEMAKGVAFADLSFNREWLLGKKIGQTARVKPDGASATFIYSPSRAIELYDMASKAWLDEKIITTPTAGKDMFTSEFVENVK